MNRKQRVGSTHERRAEQVAVAERPQRADEQPERAGAERDRTHSPATPRSARRWPARARARRTRTRTRQRYAQRGLRPAPRREPGSSRADMPVTRASSSLSTSSMNLMSTGLAPPPAKCPQTPGMTRSSPLGMCCDAHCSSSGGKYRSFSAGTTISRGLDRPQRLDVVAVEPGVAPTSPYCQVQSIVSRLLASRRGPGRSPPRTRRGSPARRQRAARVSLVDLVPVEGLREAPAGVDPRRPRAAP